LDISRVLPLCYETIQLEETLKKKIMFNPNPINNVHIVYGGRGVSTLFMGGRECPHCKFLSKVYNLHSTLQGCTMPSHNMQLRICYAIGGMGTVLPIEIRIEATQCHAE
jgi:hypothetical protein